MGGEYSAKFISCLCDRALTPTLWQPVNCCHSDIDTPLQPAETKRSISDVSEISAFFCPLIMKNYYLLSIHKKNHVDIYLWLQQWMTKCDISWTLVSNLIFVSPMGVLNKFSLWIRGLFSSSAINISVMIKKNRFWSLELLVFIYPWQVMILPTAPSWEKVQLVE